MGAYLKKELKKRGLRGSGLKQELINRLDEDNTDNAIKSTEEEKIDETETTAEEEVASDGYESSEDEQSVYNEDDIGAHEQHNE